MAEVISREDRSRLMGRVKSQDIKPKLVVRSLLHGAGFRFRPHRKDLLGKPDIVLSRHKTVIFLHACFWHGHSCLKGARPSTNSNFWERKLEGNKASDLAKITALHTLGWHAHVIWGCETKNEEHLLQKLRLILSEATQ